jgi:hypothetical protein
MVLIELLIVVAVGVVVAIIVVAWWISGPAVAGPCGLVVRTWRPDYCSGSCPAGSTCVATATRPYGWGLLGVQASACACGRIIGAVTPGGLIATPSGQPIGTGIADPAGGAPR